MTESLAHTKITGLNDEQVLIARNKSGYNKLSQKKENRFIGGLLMLLREPMVLLLLVASAIYFISGNISDGLFLASAIVLVAAISIFQDSRSRNALEKLKTLTQPVAKVIRNGKIISISSEDLVPGDSLVTEEGTYVPADGRIISLNDFSVNESILTGESMAVYKDTSSQNNRIFQGTTVITGLAVSIIESTGNETQLGKIGKSLSAIKVEKTPLEIQIANFVKKMAAAGVFFFIVVWLINYNRSADVLNSLLKALTLAMSILPEEIPVAFTTFMAIGAWRLMKMGIIVKDMKTVETLGSASVICTDKTGTITQNKMSLVKLYVFAENKICEAEKASGTNAIGLITASMWSSETIPFDPMELSIHDFYARHTMKDQRPDFQMVHEYPLEGRPPMMTHIFEDKDGNRIVAAKGAPEAFITISNLKESEKEQILNAINTLAAEGFRLLGVATASFAGSDFPDKQQKFEFDFQGLVAFYDPPKKNISSVLTEFYSAGIAVKIITGDNNITTGSIARQIGFQGHDRSITGEELMQLNEAELKVAVAEKNVFTRMFPEAKLRIINALKSRGEVVAMTGDGVNDGPALKAAHIGIAMGKKGTEIAKQAASMILIEDDLAKMVDAIRMGRRIYVNLKKAIRYIISIHIPIILIVFIPLVLGWIYPAIFSPIHVIFLELIMGPTCSIIYENEPVEENAMRQPPRPPSATFFNARELLVSVFQGLAITAGLLFIYHYSVSQQLGEKTTRTMIFSGLICANIFLTLLNRSFYYSILKTLYYPNNLILYIIGTTVIITGVLVFIEPISGFFELQPLSISQLLISISVGFLSVIWFELIKWNTRRFAIKND
ncbi:MAG: cation-translocating P-type ATPase [Phormidesmis sp. FL-bin-119]|nr:cation-translocating P-type ATPase [Pedobacter sp.]